MGADPQLWILSAGRKGDLDQMVALAEASGLSYAIKRLDFRPPRLPVLAPLLLKDRSALAAPWPQAVLCAEGITSTVALAVRTWSQGTSRTVCIGRPSGDPARFDLVITTAQYRISAAPNVVELSMPLAGKTASPAMAAAPQSGPPLVALLVGGDAFPDRLDPEVARKMLRDVAARAARRGAVLAVQTSPRTSLAVIASFRGGVAAPHRLQVFGEGPDAYGALLGRAAEIIVTSDSISMAADALAAGKPVSIYPLPRAEGVKYRLAERMNASSSAPVRWLFRTGLIEAPADRRALFARLVREKRLSWFGEEPPQPKPDAHRDDLLRAVEALRALVLRQR